MGVIINELDVVAAPPAEATAPGGPQPAGPKAPAPQPVNLEDLRNLLRHQTARATRLRAH